MFWRPLAKFRDPSVGKLHRLVRAGAKGLEVPPTRWGRAQGESGSIPWPEGLSAPLIVRSASPDEDRDGATAAGKFESVVVGSQDLGELRAACATVMDSMGGRGLVFCQPLMEQVLRRESALPEDGPRGGVVFFDGFFYERTEAEEHNRKLTSGESRGEVRRADLVRGEPFSEWLRALGRVFAHELRDGQALDVEYVRAGTGHVLLQARPRASP